MGTSIKLLFYLGSRSASFIIRRRVIRSEDSRGAVTRGASAVTLVGRQVPRASPAGSPQEDEKVTESTAPVTCTSRMLGCDAGNVNPRHSLYGPSFLPRPFCTVLPPSLSFVTCQRKCVSRALLTSITRVCGGKRALARHAESSYSRVTFLFRADAVPKEDL